MADLKDNLKPTYEPKPEQKAKDLATTNQEVKDAGAHLKNSSVAYGPQTFSEEWKTRKNEVNLSTGSFGGLGLNYNRTLDGEGRFSVGGGVGTGGILGDAPSATVRADYRFARGDWDTGSSLGTLRGELGAAVLGAVNRDTAAGAGLVTSRVTHLNSGLNASLDLGVAAVSPFDQHYRPYNSPAYPAGVAIFSVGKSF